MRKSKKFPLGIQSFQDLRQKDFAYVDKTKFIFELATRGKSYFLSRPRRFGKSLFLSTMEAYFLGQRELFDGLAIQALEDMQEDSWQEYPVFYLDLNPEKYTEEKDLYRLLNAHIREWERIYTPAIIDESLSVRFFNVIKRAYEKTGKQVIFLVDEYDKPLLQTLTETELNDKYRKILKGFYGVIKTADKYLKLSFLTGVSRFNCVSIFSDLNNLTDISLQTEYAEICGITQEELETNFKTEIEILADDNNIKYDEALAVLKKKYDGYVFCESTKNLYNPFSVLNALNSRKLKNYWFSTGTPTFLIEYLKEGHYNIPDLDGNISMDASGLEKYKADEKNPLPILFQTGYLTIKEYNTQADIYRLGFPNDEVRYAFLKNLVHPYLFLREHEAPLAIWNFYEDIQDGKVEEFMTRMRSIISGIPYDNFTEEEIHLREQNYQTAVYLIFKLMGQFVHTEVHCATGRTDCEVETENAIYIFEFKLNGKASAEDALKQIEETGYADKYKSHGKKIVMIGTAFDEKRKTIGEYVIRNASF